MNFIAFKFSYLKNAKKQKLRDFRSQGYYWCSTEMNADYAYIQSFGTGGNQTNSYKDNYWHVRAIRAF